MEIELGSDYGAEKLVSRQVRDGFGRVSFESDPHPTTQAEATAYGTSHHYLADGTPSCSIRGRGPLPYSAVTDEATERYPTCYERSFTNHQETMGVRSPDSLLAGSLQAGVVRSVTRSAIGAPSPARRTRARRASSTATTSRTASGATPASGATATRPARSTP